MTTARRSLLGVAPPKVDYDPDREGVTPEGRLTARVFRRFQRCRSCAIPAQIPRIARAMHAEEDRVWHLFGHYLRGFREPWNA
jgi:hypothetical protein